MFYRANNKIISISNIKSIELNTYGSGAKSNPYRYEICIEYFGDETNSIGFDSNKACAEKAFEEIFEKINKEG